MGEVSLKVAWDLGYSKEEANGARGPAGNFTIIIYGDEKYVRGTGNMYDEIQKQGHAIQY